MPTDNVLYYGDNLDVMRRYLKDESVDLCYLDPPFNSKQDYNAFFDEQDGTRAAAQIKAFDDTWRWDKGSAAAYQEIVEQGGNVSQVMQAFRQFLGTNDMLAYISMMAPRLVEIRRVLKPTGSVYLHCDPTASHYLKMLMDAVFGPRSFINEISWRRSGRRSSISRIYRRAHDVILFYGKSDSYFFNICPEEKDETLSKKYTLKDDKGVHRLVPLMVSGLRNGVTGKKWRGFDPNTRGKAGMHWITTHDKLDAYDAQGLVAWPKKDGGVPQLKYYWEQNKGIPLSDFWDDIAVINSMADESLRYPTQKPLALLDRIVDASCPVGGLVFDPFCGCGTAMDAAQEAGRCWIGIDITPIAINAIKARLVDRYGRAIKEKYTVVGEPVALPDAKQLAEENPYHFQYWALGLVDARPAEEKKGADKGIDGRLYFHDESETGKTKQIIFSVKAGHTGPDHVRDLRGVIDREKAAIGVLIIMEDSTKPMRTEAASADFYVSPFGKYPRLQILTVAELLAGKTVDYPSAAQRIDKTYKKAAKAKSVTGETGSLPLQ